MQAVKRGLSVWIPALLVLACLSGCGRGTNPRLILVSFDGFRWDYLDRTQTPHLDRLVSTGVRAARLIPVFPTKTFPNHYSIVTGLYPEHHGIVANNMYDPLLDASFSLANREAVAASRWWGGEPIWVTAARAGRKSATLFWPGSEAEIKGYRPTYWVKYKAGMSDRNRVHQVLAWLDLPEEERPVFLAAYFSTTDSVGHDFGPESGELREAVRHLDEMTGLLIDGLASRGLLERVNLIFTSDHGMTELDPSRRIFLDDYLDLSSLRVVDWSPVAALRPGPADVDKVFEALRGAHPHLEVYRKEEIPERFHYREHRRIAPLIAIADEGWTITTHGRVSELEAAGRRMARASHGFDNQLESMQGLFLAHGPAFRKGRLIRPFVNVHIYPLMAHLLGLAPAPNDGNLETVRELLKE
ncbi:MAG: ectonucleotide pyrophosphatase/phosphodiesterase [Acidobacteriota bacterium]